jgi:protein-tyrosine phosphatase/adenylate kinase family enzyme
MFYYNKKGLYLNITDDLSEYITHIDNTWIINQQKRDNNKYHITIINSTEINTLSVDIDDYPIDTKYSILGLKIINDIAFLIINYPAGDLFRTKYNLEPYNFHITLGFKIKDKYDIDKNITLLNYNELILENIFICETTIVQKQCNIYEHAMSLFSDNIDIIKAYCIYCSKTKQYDNIFNLGWTLLTTPNYTLGASLIFMSKKEKITPTIINYIWENIKNKLVDNKNTPLILETLNNTTDQNNFYYYIKNNTYNVTNKPNNFSCVSDNLYGSANLKDKHLDFLILNKIDIIINLMEKNEYNNDDIINITNKYKHNYYNFEIKDQDITSDNKMQEIIFLIEKYKTCNKKILVHCKGGYGRTNLILLCCILREKKSDFFTILRELKNNRKVLLSEKQEKYLNLFSVDDSNIKLPLSTIKKYPKLILLIGLPGAGKSTFSNHLLKYIKNIIRISQDEIGKKECYNILSKEINSNNTIIIDRCNSTSADRLDFLSYLKFNQTAWAVIFNTPIEECIYRAQHRFNHETLSITSAEKIITKCNIEAINNKEIYDEIIQLKSATDINYILSTWNILPINIRISKDFYPFPRTKHLYNLGAKERDDDMLENKICSSLLNNILVIEEKIDGSNIGISIDKETNKLIFQNRSNYVNNKYHPQYSKIEQWGAKHYDELINILEPGRHILYGEWVYATHSIKYNKLPDMFIAFDIYDKIVDKFYSRKKIENILKNTNIKHINLISIELLIQI